MKVKEPASHRVGCAVYSSLMLPFSGLFIIYFYDVSNWLWYVSDICRLLNIPVGLLFVMLKLTDKLRLLCDS